MDISFRPVIFLLASTIMALLAFTAPGVTPSIALISVSVMVVVPMVKEVSHDMVPVMSMFAEDVIAPHPTVPNPVILVLASTTKAFSASAVPFVVGFSAYFAASTKVGMYS
jgi:hypothetical protein